MHVKTTTTKTNSGLNENLSNANSELKVSLKLEYAIGKRIKMKEKYVKNFRLNDCYPLNRQELYLGRIKDSVKIVMRSNQLYIRIFLSFNMDSLLNLHLNVFF